MAKRTYRVNPVGAEESSVNYALGVSGKDQPNWAPEFRELITQRYGSGAKYFNELRKTAVEYLRGKVPRGLVPNYLRPILKAAKLALAGATEKEFYAELANVIVKNGVDIRVLEEAFNDIDELKKMKIDWARLESIVNALR